MATPIGNLEDITLRALRVLQEVSVVAAEDTRHTRNLLTHFTITTPLTAYHQHSDVTKTNNLVSRLLAGDSVALVSDAGTPGVSDPGLELAMAAVEAGITVVPVPGASAVLSALVGSALPFPHFTFEGFLPRTRSARREKLDVLGRREERTMVFYEAGNRTEETLRDLREAFGDDRRAVVCRELTKKHEEFMRGTLAELVARAAAQDIRGEVTLVVLGNSAPEAERDDVLPTVDEALSSAIDAGLTDRDAVKHVSELLKLGRKEVYAAMLARKNSE